MDKWTVSKRLEFDAAHRLHGYVGKCANIHGHRYQVEFVFTGEWLDGDSMVVDFGDLKKVLGGWLDEYWDHALILYRYDEIAEDMVERRVDTKMYLMETSPTAEAMAEFLYKKAEELCDFKDSPAELKSVKVYETPTGWAEYTDE